MTNAEILDKIDELRGLDTEAEWVEFKLNDRGQPMYQDTGEYLSAIANSCAILRRDRGYIAWGVNDRTHALEGTDFRPRKAKVGNEELENWLTHKLDPQIRFRIHEADSGGKHYVLFEVSPATHVPVAFAGERYVRVGSIKKRLKDCPEKERELWQRLRDSGRDFSAGICPGGTMGDLVQSSVEDFRRRWIEKTRRAGNSTGADRLKHLSHEQLLADAELIEGGHPTYAALILFGSRKALGKHLAQAEVVWEYRSTEASGPAQAREEYREGFFGFYERLWEAINTRNDKQSYQDGLYVLTIPTFNERAVREAILNAVSHRDYQLGGSVFVRQYPRRLEIDSPGGFPAGITIENVIDRQEPRNRRIAEAFTKCGLVERSGQGMNLIFEELVRESKPLPDFARTDHYQVGLTLHGTIQNPNLIRFLEQVGQETTASFTTRDWLILDLVARGQKIPKGYDGRLKHLLDLGVVERTGRRQCIFGQKFYTFAGDSSAYTRQKGLSREQNLTLLLNHIQKNSKQGSPFQDLALVLPSQSEDGIQSLLRTLKQRGQAHAVGRTKAGRWFPGPAPGKTPLSGK